MSALHFISYITSQMSWNDRILARLPMVRVVMVANILILVLGRLIYVIYDFISR